MCGVPTLVWISEHIFLCGVPSLILRSMWCYVQCPFLILNSMQYPNLFVGAVFRPKSILELYPTPNSSFSIWHDTLKWNVNLAQLVSSSVALPAKLVNHSDLVRVLACCSPYWVGGCQAHVLRVEVLKRGQWCCFSSELLLPVAYNMLFCHGFEPLLAHGKS